jgi:hypothetical protein
VIPLRASVRVRAVRCSVTAGRNSRSRSNGSSNSSGSGDGGIDQLCDGALTAAASAVASCCSGLQGWALVCRCLPLLGAGHGALPFAAPSLVKRASACAAAAAAAQRGPAAAAARCEPAAAIVYTEPERAAAAAAAAGGPGVRSHCLLPGRARNRRPRCRSAAAAQGRSSGLLVS